MSLTLIFVPAAWDRLSGAYIAFAPLRRK